MGRNACKQGKLADCPAMNRPLRMATSEAGNRESGK
jgi:hypothetical protein